MKKNIVHIILFITLLLIGSACSSGNTDKPEVKTGVPSGTWVIRYAGDENGEYVEEFNIIDDYYAGKISYIYKDILDFSRTAYLKLDENGKGTFTDEWDETVDVSFEDDKVTFSDGYETTYKRKGDLLWYKDQYRDFYKVMENVSDDLLEEIKNGAFDCVELNKAEVGSYVTIGTYDTWPYNDKTEALRWRVLDKQGDKILVLCDQLIDAFSYNYNPDLKDLDKVTWENSSLRAFLNDPEGFMAMFTDEELNRIQLTHLENNAANEELMKYFGGFVDDTSLSIIPNYSTMAVQDLPDDPATDDKIFLLSFPEIEKYLGEATEPYQGESDYPFDSYPANSKWIAYVTESVDYNLNGAGYYDYNTRAGAWTTRTLGTDHHDEKMSVYITSSGQVFLYYTHEAMFIRPAMWINVN